MKTKARMLLTTDAGIHFKSSTLREYARQKEAAVVSIKATIPRSWSRGTPHAKKMFKSTRKI